MVAWTLGQFKHRFGKSLDAARCAREDNPVGHGSPTPRRDRTHHDARFELLELCLPVLAFATCRRGPCHHGRSLWPASIGKSECDTSANNSFFTGASF